MKNRIWLLMMIAAIILASCDNGSTPEPEPEVIVPHGEPYSHLGIGEQKGADCSGKCGFQDYRTANMSNSGHADYFQWPIYRVGAKSHYQGTELTTTVNNILAAYKGLLSSEATSLKNSTLEQLRITYNAPSNPFEVATGKYTWGGNIFGIQKGNTSELIERCLRMISNGDLPPQLAIIQPTNNIRMAQGKKSTERFPAVAGGNGKLPRADRAATGFELNRQLIARNNRNVKNQWRQAQV